MLRSTLSGHCRSVLLVSLSINIALIALFFMLEQRVHLLNRMAGVFDMDIPWLGAQPQNDLKYLPIDGAAIKVYGIPSFDYQRPIYDRLAFFTHDIRQELRKISANTSGVRLRFKTDSKKLHIIAKGLHPAGFSYPSLSEAGSAGIDIFVEGKYVKTITPRTLNEVINIAPLAPRTGLAAVDIYLPTFSKCRIEQIGFDKGSKVEPPDNFPQRIAFYGTSITQGEAAPRPSLTFPAILARKLGVDFYNFGFSGNAKGDAEVADILGELRADLYVLKYSRQAVDIDGFDTNLIRFCNRILNGHPSARFLVVSAIYDASEGRAGNKELAVRRSSFFDGYKELRKSAADVYFLDGTMLLGPEDDDGLADGTHLNSLGAYRVAEKLAPVIRSILSNDLSE